MFQELDRGRWDMQSGFGQFSTVYKTQGTELVLTKLTKIVVVKTSISAHHFNRLTGNMQLDPRFCQLTVHFLLQSKPFQEDNQEKVWLMPCFWEVCPPTGDISSFGDACWALWGDCQEICALLNSLSDSYACRFKLWPKGKASPTCSNYWINFHSLNLCWLIAFFSTGYKYYPEQTTTTICLFYLNKM